MRKIAAGCWHCAWRFSSIVILNLLQDPRSIEMDTVCIFFGQMRRGGDSGSSPE